MTRRERQNELRTAKIDGRRRLTTIIKRAVLSNKPSLLLRAIKRHVLWIAQRSIRYTHEHVSRRRQNQIVGRCGEKPFKVFHTQLPQKDTDRPRVLRKCSKFADVLSVHINHYVEWPSHLTIFGQGLLERVDYVIVLLFSSNESSRSLEGIDRRAGVEERPGVDALSKTTSFFRTWTFASNQIPYAPTNWRQVKNVYCG